MNRNKLKKVLIRTSRIENEIKDIELRIEELHDIDNLGIDAVSSEERTGPTNSISSPTESKAIRIADKVAQLEYKKRHLLRLKERIDNAIAGLPHTERRIIQMRYIENEKWYTIAGEMNLYEKYCQRLSDSALDVMLSMGLEDM